MRSSVYFLACLAAGVLYVAIPHALLPVCEYAGVSAQEHAPASPAGTHGPQPSEHVHAQTSSGQVGDHMVCFWTARAEMGIGLLTVFGALLLLTGSDERRLGITLMLAGTAVVGALIPYALIGVCERETMPCRAGTLPGLLLLSGLFLGCTLLQARSLAASRRAARRNG